MLDLVRLLYSDAHADTVHTRLDKHLLVLVSRNSQGVQQQFGRAASLDFRYVMSFRRLRGEVGHRKSCRQRRANTLEVRTQGLRLRSVSNRYLFFLVLITCDLRLTIVEGVYSGVQPTLLVTSAGVWQHCSNKDTIKGNPKDTLSQSVSLRPDSSK